MAGPVAPQNPIFSMVEGLGGRPLLPSNVRTYGQAMMGRQAPITADDFSPGELDVISRLAETANTPRMLRDQVIEVDGENGVEYITGEVPAPMGSVTYQDYYAPNMYDDNLSPDFVPAEENSRLGKRLADFIAPHVSGEYAEFAKADARGGVQGTLGRFRAIPTQEGYWITDTYDFHPVWDNEGPSIGRQFIDLFGKGGDPMSILETAAIRFGPNADEGGGIPVDFVLPYREDDPRKQRIRDYFLRN